MQAHCGPVLVNKQLNDEHLRTRLSSYRPVPFDKQFNECAYLDNSYWLDLGQTGQRGRSKVTNCPPLKNPQDGDHLDNPSRYSTLSSPLSGLFVLSLHDSGKGVCLVVLCQVAREA